MGRNIGEDGFLYKVERGEAVAGGAEVKTKAAGFYQIQSIASTGSGLPLKDAAAVDGVSLTAGMVTYLKEGQALAEGDSVIPFTLTKLGYVTDVTDSSQGESHDVTTQIDVDVGIRAYRPGAFKERTGTISGYFDSASDGVMEMLREFRQIRVVTGENTTVYDSKTKIHEFMLSRDENKTVGERQVWEWFPVIVDQLQTDKPMTGPQPFSFNYRVDGSSKPAVIYIENEG